VTRPKVNFVIAHDGTRLTTSNLPPSNARWTVRLKSYVLAAVRGGLIDLEEACSRYELTKEEFYNWSSAVDQFGLSGLRATRVQDYRHEMQKGPGRD
jgi:hypothetical protein